MTQIRFTFDEDKPLKEAVDEVWERIQRCTLLVWNECQTVLHARKNPPPYKNSAPKGEPPAMRTGFGAGNVLYELDRFRLQGRVGVGRNAMYMAFQELSPRLDHPWLLPTLNRLLPQLQAIADGTRK